MAHRVLLVCLGNICRSPTAEGVLRNALVEAERSHDVEVDSAGTAGYHQGEPPDPRAIRAAARRGIDLSTLRARAVVDSDHQLFDEILAMDRANLATLKRHAQKVPNARARIALFLDDEEVPDPYYGGPEGFEDVLDRCERGAAALIRRLA